MKKCIICKDREAVIPKNAPTPSYCVPCHRAKLKVTRDARQEKVYKEQRGRLRTLVFALRDDQMQMFMAKHHGPETMEDRRLLEAIKWIRRLS